MQMYYAGVWTHVQNIESQCEPLLMMPEIQTDLPEG